MVEENNICVKKPSLGLKIQINQEKVEKMLLEKNLKDIDLIIQETQRNLNLKRFILLFSIYFISFIIFNSILFNFNITNNLFLFNSILILPFMLLVFRSAPINDNDIINTLNRKKSDNKYY